MSKLKLELATMKVMIYSLHDAINDLCKLLTNIEITELEEWENDCVEIAKSLLKKEESESEN